MRWLAEMELFVELAKVRNFGRAAAALGITASTLSRRMTSLEKEIGVPLIRRSTRSFALTESGQEFFERSQKIMVEAARAHEEISATFTKVSGHLRVGTPSDLAMTILAPVFAKYCRENPSVSIEIIATQRQPDLIGDSLDVAFVVAHQVALPDSSFPARPVGSFSRMMYASRLYLRRKGVPTSPQELREHACIRYIYGSGSAEKHWDLHQGRKRETVAVEGACASSSVAVSAQAAREHLGIAMLPRYLASHPTFGAGLVRVLPDWEGARANVFALSVSRVLPAKIQELIQVVKTEFSKQVAQLEAVS